jgi:16S rRNA (guanine527-N7)-methyltransferase
MDAVAALNLSDAGMERLRLFQALVEKWTPKINLIARSTIPEIWSRHIADSARLCLVQVPKGRRWVDLGSGGGFPGLVIAVCLADRKEKTEVVLVESDQRKATFLREAARQMGLAVTVRAERAEVLEPQGAEVVSARALASLSDLCGFAARHMAPGGLCLFPKGEKSVEEVAEARKSWRFELETVENMDHKGSALLVLRNLERAD